MAQAVCQLAMGWTEDRLCGGVVTSSWLQIQGAPGSIPGDTRFLRSSGSGAGYTQPRVYN
jgi:hypothetical protein